MTMIDQLPEVLVPVSLLVPGFALREDGTDADHVRLLADSAESAKLPPILVQKHGLRIIDGMHRVEVAKLRGEWSITARVIDCTDEEALVLAVGSNTLHGLPLTRADRVSSAKRILAAHPEWSDRSVAGITGLSAKAIASVRNTVMGETPFNGKRLGRDGKRRPVTPGEGRRRAEEYIAAHPEASLREVARETDVSLGTVHDVRERLRRDADSGTHDIPGPAKPVRRAADRVAPLSAPAASASPVPGGGTGPSARVQPINGARSRDATGMPWSAISSKLVRDPTIRYTEGGRAFLQWMATHSMQSDEWREFLDAIPQHWLEDLSRIALSMSEEWRQFADGLVSKLEAVS
jgi:hypothetical protein